MRRGRRGLGGVEDGGGGGGGGDLLYRRLATYPLKRISLDGNV